MVIKWTIMRISRYRQIDPSDLHKFIMMITTMMITTMMIIMMIKMITNYNMKKIYLAE